MNKKSLIAGIVGILDSAFFIGWGYVCLALSALILAIISIGEGNDYVLSLLPILSIICMAGGVIGIAGSIICFKKVQIGKYFLLATAVLSGMLDLYLIILSIISFSITSIIAILICTASLSLIVFATIMAFIASKEQQNNKVDMKENA